jgi:general secretion pathway protein G
MLFLALLNLVFVPKLGGHEKLPVKAAIADMANIKTQLEAFKAQNGRLPKTEEGLQALVSNPGNLPAWSKSLDRVPKDPWNREYIYRCPDAYGDKFDLYSTGPSGKDGAADNIRSN